MGFRLLASSEDVSTSISAFDAGNLLVGTQFLCSSRDDAENDLDVVGAYP